MVRLSNEDFIQNAAATIGYILVFLGVQVYLGEQVQKFPWLFVVSGLMLAMFAVKIARWLT